METDNERLSILSKTSETEDTIPVSLNDALESAGCGLGTAFLLTASYYLLAFEVVDITVMSIVGLVVKCEWDLDTTWMTATQEANVVGQFLAGIIFSNVGEKYGRRSVMLVGAIGLTVLSSLSALSQNMWHLIISRTLVGAVFAFCGPAAAVYPAEVTNVRWRTFALSSTGFAWGIASTLTSAIAYFTMDTFGWRGFVLVSAVVFSPSILMVYVAKESPRFDLYKGNVKSAENTINFLTKWNGNEQGIITLQHHVTETGLDEPPVHTHSGIWSILRASGKLLDLILIVTLFYISIFMYYSLSYATPRFLNENFCTGRNTTKDASCVFDKDVLFDIGVVGLGEPIACLIAIYVLDRIGRRRTNALVTLIILVLLCGMYDCIGYGQLMGVLVLLRGLISVLSSIPLILIREHFPTSIRGFCYHVLFVVGRVGIMSALFVTQFAYDYSPKMLVGMIHASTLLYGAIQIFLKMETAGVQID